MARATPKNRSRSRILGPVGVEDRLWRKGNRRALGAGSGEQCRKAGGRRQENERPARVWGRVGTSSADMVEGISHRPGQKGDASNCSNVKERGCGLWARAGEEGACLWCPCFCPLRTFGAQSYLQCWGTREQDLPWGWPLTCSDRRKLRHSCRHWTSTPTRPAATRSITRSSST